MFGRRLQQPLDMLAVFINSAEIDRVSQHKFLRDLLVENPNVTQHIIFVTSKVSRFVIIFNNIRSFLDSKILLLVYYTLVNQSWYIILSCEVVQHLLVNKPTWNNHYVSTRWKIRGVLNFCKGLYFTLYLLSRSHLRCNSYSLILNSKHTKINTSKLYVII